MRARFPIFMVISTFSSGCLESAWQDVAEHFTDTATTAATTAASTSSNMTPTTTAGSGVQTVTGATDETTAPAETTWPAETTSSSSSTSPEDNEPPTVKLTVDKAYLSEAGTADLLLEASMDVVKVRLSMNGAPLVELTPADFPYTYEALSAKDNGAPHVFEVEVEDAEGLTATDDAELTVQLPASGAERCLFTDTAAKQSVISALVYTDEAIVAVGWRDAGSGPRATVWKLPPDHCEQPLPGWPKTIANWTDEPLAALESRASAVAVDDLGNLAVGINLINGGKPQRYVAFLTPGGSLLWHKPGKVGEEVAGIAIAPTVVAAVGWMRTSENPVRTDAMLWRHLEGGSVWPETLRAPFTPEEFDSDINNQFSEWARAVLYDPETDLLVVAGEREFKPNQIDIYPRAFVARFIPLGLQYGDPWTSPGDPLKKDGATSLYRCGADILVGGWTQDEPPGSLAQPLTRWLDADGAGTKRVPEQLSNARTFGLACDREGKIIHAAVRILGESHAQVFAFADPNEPRIWYDKGGPGNDAAGAIDCDARGFCGWGGFRTMDGKIIAVVRVHHP